MSPVNAAAGLRRSAKPELARPHDRLGPVAHLQAAQDGSDVDLHRSLGEAQLAADELVRLPLRQQAKNIELPWRQARGAGRRWWLAVLEVAEGSRRSRHLPRRPFAAPGGTGPGESLLGTNPLTPVASAPRIVVGSSWPDATMTANDGNRSRRRRRPSSPFIPGMFRSMSTRSGTASKTRSMSVG